MYAEDEFDPANGSGSMDLIYPTKDGFITAGVISDKEWVGMCKALKREDLMDDERFSTIERVVKTHRYVKRSHLMKSRSAFIGRDSAAAEGK